MVFSQTQASHGRVSHVLNRLRRVPLLKPLGKRGRNVGLTWLAIYFLSDILTTVLEATTLDDPLISLLSIRQLFLEAAKGIFDAPGAVDEAPYVLLALGVTLAVLLIARVRGLQQREA